MSKTKKTEREVTAWYDARCPKCGKRIGWFGRLSQKPPCKHCKQVQSAEEAALIQKNIRQLDTFCLLQTLYHEQFNRMAPTEASFIVNMYKRGQKKRGYSEIQKVSIRHLAVKYSVRSEHANDDKDRQNTTEQSHKTSASPVLQT